MTKNEAREWAAYLSIILYMVIGMLMCLTGRC